jgi:hypothetical protein
MLVRNSEGIGLATTRRLLVAGWEIIGFSRSESLITSTTYHHQVADVSDRKYSELIDGLVLKVHFDLYIYFVGIGELLDPLKSLLIIILAYKTSITREWGMPNIPHINLSTTFRYSNYLDTPIFSM